MTRLTTVEIVGGGPAGLYTAILLKRRMPWVQVRVQERNARGATFGFGVVFSDRALDFLKADDAQTHDLVVAEMQHWQGIRLNTPSGSELIDGIGFSAIGRATLNDILTRRAEELGVDVHFGVELDSLTGLHADLIVGADGLNSLVRRASEAAFAPKVEHFSNHFAWFGALVPFEELTQTFVKTDKGTFNAHHYRYSADRSTFVVECDDATYQAYGFAALSEEESAGLCSEIFAEALQGTDLITNASMWRQFPRLWCDKWVNGRQVILGDAAHTAHFSIGSGTRLAMEDGAALVANLCATEDLDAALAGFQNERPRDARKIVDAANTSAKWYEGFADKLSQAPLDFAFDYVTRSGRIDKEQVEDFAPAFMARYEAAKIATPDVIRDPVNDSAPGASEIGFDRAAHTNCSDMLWQNLSRNPDRQAVIGPHGTMSYRQLTALAGQWGNAFAAAGLKRGERIAFYLDDSPSFPAAFFGAVRAGFVPVLLNIQTKPDVLNYFLHDSGAALAVVDADLTEAFAGSALEGTSLRQIIVANGLAHADNQVSATDFVAPFGPDLPCADTGPDDMAFWMYSSGSTGRPKGIVHLHHDMAYVQAAFGAHVLKLGPDDITYSVPKMYFAYGFGNSIIFPFSVGAAALLVPGQPRPDVVLDAVEAYRPTVLFGLPTLYTALAKSEGIAKRDLSSLRQSMSAAEILSEEVYTQWKAKVGHGPTEGLGSTEMLHIYLSNGLDDHRLGAAGARVPGYEIRLETPEGLPAAPGEEGVMFVRGHSSAPCYWNRPDKTRESMRGDWLYTGDRFVERDGYYYFQGRADDLIKVSGQWVWPLEVERCLNEHPDVHECAVLAHQLSDKRMALRAVVSLVKGVTPDEAQTAKLRDFVKDVLTPFKSPRLFEYREELPKTGTGKIDRQALLVPANNQS